MIQIQNVRKVYQTGRLFVEALQGVSFTIKKGEFVSIMGPSGSGKSTLMNILGCLDRPTSGTYRLNSIDVAHLSDNRLSEVRNKEIGFVFQQFHLLPRITIQQNVEVPLVYAGVNSRQRRERARQLLEMVELGDRTHHKPNELSGGQKQRAAIARALVNNPSIVLADEPTGNLDSKTGIVIMELLAKLHSMGHTIILVTHNAEISEYTRRVIRLRDGCIASDEINMNPRISVDAGGEIQ
jgi:putative ABC transport system ATP-binding protein